MNPFMLILALVTSYVFIVEGQSSCATPSGEVVSCISLYDCSELLDIAENPNKSQKDIEHLRSFACGFEKNTPRVCCPTQNQSNLQSLPPEQDPNFNPDLIKECNGIPGVTPPHPYSGCCGIQADVDRLSGGNITDIYKHPWLVQIEYSKDDNIVLPCEGVLISDRYVLTAAHCVVGEMLAQGTPRNVRLGEYDTSNEVQQMDCINYNGNRHCTDGAVVIPIESIIPHPDYDSKNILHIRHDIALLRMTTSAPYSDFIRPICLPTSDMTLSPPANWKLIAAGWGSVNKTHVSKVKLETELPFVTQDECHNIYTHSRLPVILDQDQICAGTELGEVKCKEDSGPLTWENRKGKKFYELVGIASFGSLPCPSDRIPGLYTKVYEYISWIHQTVKP